MQYSVIPFYEPAELGKHIKVDTPLKSGIGMILNEPPLRVGRHVLPLTPGGRFQVTHIPDNNIAHEEVVIEAQIGASQVERPRLRLPQVFPVLYSQVMQLRVLAGFRRQRIGMRIDL